MCKDKFCIVARVPINELGKCTLRITKINGEFTVFPSAGTCTSELEAFDGNNVHIQQQKQKALPYDNMHAPFLSELSFSLITLKNLLFSVYQREPY